jgi:hypothetical protein
MIYDQLVSLFLKSLYLTQDVNIPNESFRIDIKESQSRLINDKCQNESRTENNVQ